MESHYILVESFLKRVLLKRSSLSSSFSQIPQISQKAVRIEQKEKIAVKSNLPLIFKICLNEQALESSQSF